MLQAGDRLDHYVIEEVLGQGSMGCVYRASDARLERRVALKVLSPDADADAMMAAGEAAQRMRREALASASIDHPNAVQVYDVGEWNGSTYIAMELIVGKTFRAYIDEGGVPWTTKLRWLLDAARALGAAHRAGLIHRDVKPDNVMVREDGVVKVLDFGVARAMTGAGTGGKSQPGWTKLTVDGRILGTPAYMAPEQLNAVPLDGRADQFSWGVMAYELFVGSLPWNQPKLTALFVAILSQEVRDLPGTGGELPQSAKAAILRTLAKEPAGRFATMEELVLALEPHVVTAPPAPPMQARLRLGRGFTEPFPQSRSPASQPASSQPTPFSQPAPLSQPRRVGGGTEPLVPQIHLPLQWQGPAGAGPLLLNSKPGAEAEPHSQANPAHQQLPPAAAAPAPAARTAPAAATAPQGTAPTTKDSAQARRGLSPMAIVLLTISLITVLAIAFIVVRKVRSRPPEPVPPPPAPTATAVTDLPRPPSSSPRALAAYLAGLQSLRDGSGQAATQSFTRAVSLDDSLAAAHLRLSFSKLGPKPSEAREHFRKASQLRTLLSERDQVWLSAVEPLVAREPSDFGESERRHAAAIERYPLDAELRFYHAMILVHDMAAAVKALDEALYIDPKFALAWWVKAQRQAYLGDIEAAQRSLEECLRVSPSAAECLENRVWIDEEQGECARVEGDARKMIAANSEGWEGYRHLAKALYAQGKPLETVREALQQRLARMPVDERIEAELSDRIHVAILTGDFVGAERAATDLQKFVAERPAAEDHARPARRLVEIYLETTRAGLAGKTASDFLKRRDAWAADARAEDFAMAKDPTALMLLAERRAGVLSQGAFEEKRTAWVHAWEARAAPSAKSFLWIHNYAAVAETAADAKAALDALPGYLPLPRFRPLTLADAWIGTTYLLGDRTEEAIPLLRRAVRSCLALEHPIQHTQAHFHLGTALAKSGNKEGACEALAIVRSRWGSAKPKSVTADRAMKLMAALRCKP